MDVESTLHCIFCGTVHFTLHMKLNSNKYVYSFIAFTLGVISHVHPPFFAVGTVDSAHEVKSF